MIPYEIAEQVNKTINESVEYKTDLRLYGKLEHAAPAVLEGDCEDYALAKRKNSWNSELIPNIKSKF